MSRNLCDDYGNFSNCPYPVMRDLTLGETISCEHFIMWNENQGVKNGR